jgi:hypothetical protein
VVKVMLGPNRMADRHIFWLERVDPSRPPVDETGDEEPEEAPELPPAAEGGR